MVPLNFGKIPEQLGDSGRAVWFHLARHAEHLTEGDRPAVVAYTEALEAAQAASAAIRKYGVLVEGRSTHDRERLVRNPAFSMWASATAQARGWADALRLTPRSRSVAPEVPDPETNPFVLGNTVTSREPLEAIPSGLKLPGAHTDPVRGAAHEPEED